MTRIALAAAFLLPMAACTYEHPLTAADPAVTDDQLVGLWHVPELADLGSADFMVLPLRGGRYLLTLAATGPEAPELRPDARTCERALQGWELAQLYFIVHVSDLEGARFLNLESVCGDEGYVFARYWVRGDTLRFTTVDNLEGSFESSAEIAAAVRARLDDPQLYGDTIPAYRAARRTVSVAWPGDGP